MNAVVSTTRAPEEAQASLALVSREVSIELNEARAALEAFAEQTADGAKITRFVTNLNLPRGALRLVEVYGGALLAEEMERSACTSSRTSARAASTPTGWTR